jgi:hypothetical protein
MTSLLSSEVTVVGATELLLPPNPRSAILGFVRTSLFSLEATVEEYNPLPPAEPVLSTLGSIISEEVTVTARERRERKPGRPWWIALFIILILAIVLASRRKREERRS